jgi:hypothetical protein
MAVQLPAEIAEVVGARRGVAAEQRLQACHEQRGGESFPGDVGDRDPEAAGPQG